MGSYNMTAKQALFLWLLSCVLASHVGANVDEKAQSRRERLRALFNKRKHVDDKESGTIDTNQINERLKRIRSKIKNLRGTEKEEGEIISVSVSTSESVS